MKRCASHCEHDPSWMRNNECMFMVNTTRGAEQYCGHQCKQENPEIIGSEIFERLKAVQTKEFQDALDVCRRLASYQPVEDGELIDAFFVLISYLDLANPLLPVAAEMLKRYMRQTGEVETPAGLKLEWLEEKL